MRKFLRLTLLFFLPICLFSASNLPTEKIYRSDQISDWDAFIEEGTLVVLDIDDTILISLQALGREAGLLHVNQVIQEKMDPDFAQKCKDTWWSLCELLDFQAVEEETASWVAAWQERGIPVLGLTARPNQVRMREMTVRHLTHISVFMSDLFNEDELFYKGIAFAGDREKGEVLNEILRLFDTLPQRVVFVDNNLRNVQSVVDHCQQTDLVPIYYTRAHEVDDSLAKKIALLQLTKFAVEGVCLSDEEALELID